jgi:hypothetical protein
LLSYEGRTWKYNIDEFTAVKKKKKLWMKVQIT